MIFSCGYCTTSHSNQLSRFSRPVYSLKIKSVDIYEDAERKANLFDKSKLFSSRRIPQGAIQELSYKFLNKKLELKTEMRKGSIERIFYDIAIPAEAPLFVLRIDDISVFPVAEPKTDDVKITGDLDCNQFMFSFSFEASNGAPWVDMLAEGKRRVESKMLLQGLIPNKLYIFATCDTDIPKGPKGLSIWIPESHKITKIT